MACQGLFICWLVLFKFVVMGSIALTFHSSSAATSIKKTYIVQTMRSGMPAVFVNPTHWYTSTLASIRKEASITSQYANETNVSSQEDDSPNLIYTYRFASHGFAARLTEQEAMSLVKVPGFLSVIPDKLFKLQTTYTPEFMGLDPHTGIWPKASFGKDVIVGLLDTGIWPESKSFDDTGMGPVPERWKGDCVDGFDFDSSLCNRKLVGAKYFLSEREGPEQDSRASDRIITEYMSPRDVQGHGTHTASTIAGVHVANASFFGYANGTAKGIAPDARIAVYKVCWASLGGCLGADLLAGMDEAISDGVDIISISLGGSSVPLYEDPLAIGAFGAISHGILVSCAAGNGGPSPSSVLNNAPWILTVAASTVDRNFPAMVKLGNGSTYVGQSLYTGELPAPEQLPLVSMGLCEDNSLDMQNVEGKIVICQQSRQQRQPSAAAVVAAAGGAAEILVQQRQSGHSIVSSSFLVPSVNVDADDGAAIQEYAARGRNRKTTAAISLNGTQFGKQRAPTVASFSSRGPNSIVPSILKPDITAPGVSILAAWSEAPPTLEPLDNRKTAFNIISGTSMACPHVTGLVALVLAVHPNWSAAAIKSALMTTASTSDSLGKPILVDDYRGMPATPFDYGAGQVDPNAAMDPGLVYDISVQDYVDLLCSLGFEEQELLLFTRGERECSNNYKSKLGPEGSNLNYPALVVDFKEGSARKEATLKREVTNVGAASSVYKVELEEPQGVHVKVVPEELSFSTEGEKHSFEVQISATRKNTSRDGMSSSSTFGFLTWVDTQRLHKVRSPIVIAWS